MIARILAFRLRPESSRRTGEGRCAECTSWIRAHCERKQGDHAQMKPRAFSWWRAANCSQEDVSAGRTTSAVPEAFSKRLIQRYKGTRPKSSLLQCG